MTKNNVCAVMVTFHPPEGVIENIAKVRPQVQALVVVDNASHFEELAPLRMRKEELGFELIEKADNSGIAHALNIGVSWAIAQNYQWIALFDQDSTVTDGYIQTILAFYNHHPRQEQLAIVGPIYRNRLTGRSDQPKLVARDGGPIEIMTSGSMVPARVFERCGLFQEDLVIDQVDHEFSMRVREHGYMTACCPRAILDHVFGEPSWYELFGKRIFKTTHHSAKRRYYMTRNGVLMVKKYWRRYPRWSLQTCSGLIKAPMKVVIAEHDRWHKLRFILMGVVDGCRGKVGQVVKL